jgi:hypothetical protein
LNSNTLIPVNGSSFITATTTTAKFLILANIVTSTATINTQSNFTIARSTASPTGTNSTNLAFSGGLISSNLVNVANYYIAALNVFSTRQSSCQLSYVDTPGATGTYYYSVWGIVGNSGAVSAQNVMLTVLQISP